MKLSKINNKYKNINNKFTKKNKHKNIYKNKNKIFKGGSGDTLEKIKSDATLKRFNYISIEPNGWSLYNAILKSIDNDLIPEQISLEKTLDFIRKIIDWLTANRDVKIPNLLDDYSYKILIENTKFKIDGEQKLIKFEEYIQKIITINEIDNNPILWDKQSSKIICFAVAYMLNKNIHFYNNLNNIKLQIKDEEEININEDNNIIYLVFKENKENKENNYYDILIKVETDEEVEERVEKERVERERVERLNKERLERERIERERLENKITPVIIPNTDNTNTDNTVNNKEIKNSNALIIEVPDDRENSDNFENITEVKKKNLQTKTINIKIYDLKRDLIFRINSFLDNKHLLEILPDKYYLNFLINIYLAIFNNGYTINFSTNKNNLENIQNYYDDMQNKYYPYKLSYVDILDIKNIVEIRNLFFNITEFVKKYYPVTTTKVLKNKAKQVQVIDYTGENIINESDKQILKQYYDDALFYTYQILNSIEDIELANYNYYIVKKKTELTKTILPENIIQIPQLINKIVFCRYKNINIIPKINHIIRYEDKLWTVNNVNIDNINPDVNTKECPITIKNNDTNIEKIINPRICYYFNKDNINKVIYDKLKSTNTDRQTINTQLIPKLKPTLIKYKPLDEPPSRPPKFNLILPKNTPDASNTMGYKNFPNIFPKIGDKVSFTNKNGKGKVKGKGKHTEEKIETGIVIKIEDGKKSTQFPNPCKQCYIIVKLDNGKEHKSYVKFYDLIKQYTPDPPPPNPPPPPPLPLPTTKPKISFCYA